MSFTTPFGSYFSFSTISLSVPDAMILAFIVFLVCWRLKFRNNSPLKTTLKGLLFLYVGALLALTQVLVLPGGWHLSAGNTAYVLSLIQFDPLQSAALIYRNCTAIGNYSAFVRLVIGNILLLAPLGVLLPLINKKYRFWKVSLVGLCTSLGIEGLQLVGNLLYGNALRTVEIDDVIFNTLGCMAAYLLLALCRVVVKKLNKAIN